MRTPSGKLIINFADNTSEKVSGSFTEPPKSTTNENTTTYALYPEQINEVPIITKGIYEASQPPILREEAAVDKNYNENLYLSADGFVKVVVGADFQFKVEAVQPDTLNVENGIPTVIPRTESITYTWSKDGVTLQNNSIFLLEIDNDQSFIKVEDNKLIFVNVLASAIGSYVCDISNDVGSISSEVIDLDVLDPMSQYSTDFFTNLVQNPFAQNDIDGWNSIQGTVESTELLQEDGVEPLQKTLKRPENDQQGFIADQFYPHPSNLDVTNIKNYDVYQISKGNAKYLTREKISYITAGGIKKVAVYQDIDLSNITNYIQGSVYGVEGVKAFFGCYIGNALTRMIPVREAVPLSNRQNKLYYFQGAPRISVENFLNAGTAAFGESLQVLVQEFNNETSLTSKIIQQINGVIRVNDVQQVSLIDPITKKINEIKSRKNAPPSVYPVDKYKVGYTLKPTDSENIILTAYNELYKDVYRYYTQGQYVEYNPVYFDRLNKKTNKVRITLVFDINDPRFYEYIWYDPTSEDLADLLVFDNTNITGTFKSQPNTYDAQGPNAPRYLVYDVVKSTTDGQTAESNGSLQQAFGIGSKSKTLATGFVFSLYPVTSKTKQLIGNTNTEFVDKVIGLPTPSQDSRINITPLRLGLQYTKTNLEYERWKIIFDMRSTSELLNNSAFTDTELTKLENGLYRVDVLVQKYNKTNGVFESQTNFPTFSNTAKVIRYNTNNRTPTLITGVPATTINSINSRFGSVDFKQLLFQNSSRLGESEGSDGLDVISGLSLVRPLDQNQTWLYTQRLIGSDMASLPNDVFDLTWNYRMMFEARQITANSSGASWYFARDFQIALGQLAPFTYTWTTQDFQAPSGLGNVTSEQDYQTKLNSTGYYGLSLPLNQSGGTIPSGRITLATAFKNPINNPSQLKYLENFVYDEEPNRNVLHMFEYDYYLL